MGFPIQKSPDQRLVGTSPKRIAASRVFHRHVEPRHPPYALNFLLGNLEIIFYFYSVVCSDRSERYRRCLSLPTCSTFRLLELITLTQSCYERTGCNLQITQSYDFHKKSRFRAAQHSIMARPLELVGIFAITHKLEEYSRTLKDCQILPHSPF